MNETLDLTLYVSPLCGFCYRVTQWLETQGLQDKVRIENISKNAEARTELIKGGGKSQVPALKIGRIDSQPHWMYESLDIISFIEQELR